MSAPATIEEFLSVLDRTSLLEQKAVRDYVEGLRTSGRLPGDPKDLAKAMVRDGLLTFFQAQQVVQGKTKGFTIAGKYKLLEHLGEGGMGSVYLCEHVSMRRRVAIKVLPLAKAKDASYLERFYREARAVAALDHVHIVRAHDIDHDGKLHFLVMEYVDGSSLQQIVQKGGPMDVIRACHYIAQAALGLQAAHEAGLVHRDIKPGNILVDRNGLVKILDLGLARFFNDDDNLSKKYEETVLGTTDYLAPEQAVDSSVDIRADVYSLGATFYYLLTGRTLFGEGLAAQKLIWHQTRQPKPIRSLRPEVPEELAELIEKRMLAKDPAERFQVPIEVAEALIPWTQTPIPPPPAEEMPQLCPAASRGELSDGRGTPRTPNPTTRTGWTVSGSLRSSGGPATIQPPEPGRTRTREASPTFVPIKSSSPPRPPAPEAAPTTIRGGDKNQTPGASAVRKTPDGDSSRKKGLKAAPQSGPPRAMDALQGLPVGAWITASATLVVLVFGAILWWALAGSGGGGDNAASSQGPPLTGVPARIETPPPRDPRPSGGPPPTDPNVSIQEANGVRRIRTPNYEATVEADGCMTSLRAGGVELLWPGLGTSRGISLTQGESIHPLTNIVHPDPKTVWARGSLGTVRYEFAGDSFSVTAVNATEGPMNCFFVFAAAVQAVAGDAGEWARPPAKREWSTITLFAGPAKVTLSGGNRALPWMDKAQAFQAALAPHETRKVVLKIGGASQEEAARAEAVASGDAGAFGDLAVQSPRNYQVFQRYARLRGHVLLQGRVKPFCTRVEARLTGPSLDGPLPGRWQEVNFNAENRSFDTTIPAPAGGWYKLELRALRDAEAVASAVVEHVGVGEVFIGAGGSNATNCGEERLRPQSGFVSTFDGSRWRLADDPQPGVHDKTGGGSFWPAFGDALYARYKVPIGVASTGHSGSSVKQWQKGGAYYQWLMKRIEQLGTGGFRAVLWHQGEADVRMTAEEYAGLLRSLLENTKKDAGWDFPWFVAQVSYNSPREPSFPTTRAGQKKLWETGVALEGPDTDTLTGDNRDDGGKGIHFSSKGLRAHGKLWADKVGIYLDKILAAQ